MAKYRDGLVMHFLSTIFRFGPSQVGCQIGVKSLFIEDPVREIIDDVIIFSDSI